MDISVRQLIDKVKALGIQVSDSETEFRYLVIPEIVLRGSNGVSKLDFGREDFKTGYVLSVDKGDKFKVGDRVLYSAIGGYDLRLPGLFPNSNLAENGLKVFFERDILLHLQ